jgi:DNA-binding NtrC family response regulator
MMDRAVLLCDDDRLTPEHLPLDKMGADRAALTPAAGAAAVARVAPPEEGAPASLRDEVQAAERRRIVEALEQCQGNQTRAAQLLGISRRTLVSRLDQYGLPRPRTKR